MVDFFCYVWMRVRCGAWKACFLWLLGCLYRFSSLFPIPWDETRGYYYFTPSGLVYAIV
jgi:hypothetical protein